MLNDVHKNSHPESPKLLQKEVTGWRQNIPDGEEEKRGWSPGTHEPPPGEAESARHCPGSNPLQTVPSLTASATTWVTGTRDSLKGGRQRMGIDSVGPTVTTRVTLVMLRSLQRAGQENQETARRRGSKSTRTKRWRRSNASANRESVFAA